MITVHIIGTVTKAPEVRQTSKGNPYTTAVLLTGEGDSATIINVAAFDPLSTTLAGLVKGDTATVIGAARVSAYLDKKSGDPRASLSVTASRLITTVDMVQPPRAKATTKVPERYLTKAATAEAVTDAIPF